jgi:hypothetical protein
LFFQNKTATKSPFSAEILGSRKPEQRNNSELSAVLTLKQRITAKPVIAFVANALRIPVRQYRNEIQYQNTIR